MKELTSILDVVVACSKCGWVGLIRDTEADCDGDGGMGCPVSDCGGEVQEKNG